MFVFAGKYMHVMIAILVMYPHTHKHREIQPETERRLHEFSVRGLMDNSCSFGTALFLPMYVIILHAVVVIIVFII